MKRMFVGQAYARPKNQKTGKHERLTMATIPHATEIIRSGRQRASLRLAVDEVEDDYEVEDFVLHILRFQKCYVHQCTAQPDVNETG